MGGSLQYEEILEIYRKYPAFKKITSFVETGTYKGDTSLMAAKYFEKVFTMEIVEELYLGSKERATREGVTNITFYLGDSLDNLPKILPQIKEGAVFFIDAHQSGPDTSNNKKQLVPLFEELDIILTQELGPSLFIFDDVRFWKYQSQSAWDWAHISDKKILERFGHHDKDIIDFFISNDRFFVLTI
jgi:hypothetical protein